LSINSTTLISFNSILDIHVGLTYPTADRDFNDGTSIVIYPTAGTAETPARTYDFGVVKERFVYIKISYSSYARSKFYISEDGSTWSLILDTGSVTYVGKLRFRYLRWSYYNSTGYDGRIDFSTVEVFDLDDYTASSTSNPTTTSTLHIDGFGDIGWVWLDGRRLTVYAYRFSSIKVSPVFFEVRI